MESKSVVEVKIDENGFVVQINQGMHLQQEEIVPNEKVTQRF